MTNEQESKKIMLESLIWLHNFCEENNINYFMIGGTLLGSVRHKGFIPWDDDIDIAMPREDYERFILLQSKITAPYSFEHYSTNSSVHFSFIKFFNSKLRVSESGYKNYNPGVWIDIFPLDFTFSDPDERSLQFKKIKFYRRILSYKNASFYNSSMKNIAKNFISFFLEAIPIRALLKKIDRLEKLSDDKVLIANLHGTWGDKEVVPANLISSKKLYEFEGNYFWSFSDCDKWLSSVYGDYMKLPPESDQIARHGVVYAE